MPVPDFTKVLSVCDLRADVIFAAHTRHQSIARPLYAKRATQPFDRLSRKQQGAVSRDYRRKVRKLDSCSVTVVIVEETTNPFALFHDCRTDVAHLQWNDEAVLQFLMVPLNVVMRYEFSNAVSQRIFTKE